MKRLLRIMVGTAFSPILILMGTWIWIFDDGGSWSEDVGGFALDMITGRWESMPD